MVSKAEDHEAQEADDVRAVEQLPHVSHHAVTTASLTVLHALDAYGGRQLVHQ